MQIKGDKGSWQACPRTVLRGRIADGQQARQKHSGSRSKACALERAWSRKLARIERQEKAARLLTAKLRRELGLDEKDVWGRGLKLRLTASQRPKRKIKKGGAQRKSVRNMPGYKKCIVDAKGRTAVFFRIRYMGLKSPKWRAGCTVDHAYYIMRADGVETVDGEAAIRSNMGEDPEEIAGCWKVLEEVERAYRSNAKVQYRIIVNLPHELSPEQRLQWLDAYCERQFARYGLPFVAALHKPDAGGDARNFHAHICFSTRPVERTGPYEWEVAEEKVTDLARKENLLTMRAEVAAQLNRSCRKAGVKRRFTHLSYAARKLDVLPQAHAGPERSAAFRSGEEVKLIAQNVATIERNEAHHQYRLAELATLSALCSGISEWAGRGVTAASKAAARTKEIGELARLRQVVQAAAEHLAAFDQRATLLRQQHASHWLLVEQARAARKKALMVRGPLGMSQDGVSFIPVVVSADRGRGNELRLSSVASATRSIRRQADKMCAGQSTTFDPTPAEQARHLARTLAARADAVTIKLALPTAQATYLGQDWHAAWQVRQKAIRFSELSRAIKLAPPDRASSQDASHLRVAAKAYCDRQAQLQAGLATTDISDARLAITKSCKILRAASAALVAHSVEPISHASLRAAGERLAAMRKEAKSLSVTKTEPAEPPRECSSTDIDQNRSTASVTADSPETAGEADRGAGQQVGPSKSAGRGFDAQQAQASRAAGQEW